MIQYYESCEVDDKQLERLQETKEQNEMDAQDLKVHDEMALGGLDFNWGDLT